MPEGGWQSMLEGGWQSMLEGGWQSMLEEQVASQVGHGGENFHALLAKCAAL